MHIHTAPDINLTLAPAQYPEKLRRPEESSRKFVVYILSTSDSTQMDLLDAYVSNPAENNGPLMSVVTWCLVSVSGIFLAIRLWIRQSQGKMWLDDCLLIISWVSDTTVRDDKHLTDIVQLLLLTQVTINQLSINMGYGKHTLDRKTPEENATLCTHC